METQESQDFSHPKPLVLVVIENPPQRQPDVPAILAPLNDEEGSQRSRVKSSRWNAHNESLADNVTNATETGPNSLALGTDISSEFPISSQQHAIVPGIRDSLSQSELQSTVPESPINKMTPPDSFPGDTQPVSQSVFDSIINRSKTSQEAFEEKEPGQTEDGVTQRTLNEGDTGHLDLLSDFVDTRPVDPEGEEGIELDLGDSSPTRYQPFPESQRFVSRTPASEKNGNSSDNLATITPSFSHNPLAGDGMTVGSVMPLTQVFNATQALSSPATNMHRPDFSSDMPSPNLPIQGRPVGVSLFSPLHAISSATRPRFMEPQVNYISMKESQAARDRLAEEQKLRSMGGLNLTAHSDDEFETEESFIRRRIRQKRTDDEVCKQFANISAPPRPVSDGRTRKGTPSPSSHIKETETRVRHKPISMATLEEQTEERIATNARGGDSEEETEQEDEHDLPPNRQLQRPQSSSEEDKENIDSGPIQVPNTAVRAHDALSQALDRDESPSVGRSACLGVSDPSKKRTTTENQNETTESGEPNPGSQIVTILNSQPSPNRVTRAGTPLSTLHLGLKETSHESSSIASKSVFETAVEDGVLSSPLTKSQMHSSSSPPRYSFEGDTYYCNDGAQFKPDRPYPSIMASTARHSISPRSAGSGNLHINISEHLQSPDHDKMEQNLSSSKSTAMEEPLNIPKDSSIPSRVFETPLQNNTPSKDYRRTIPETSPSYQRNPFRLSQAMKTSPSHVDYVSPTRDDDDLPDAPKFAHNKIVEQLYPLGGLPRAAPNRILSSPSGRQRRTMSEIASDPSPRRSLPDVSVDFGLLSAEDKEFQFALAEPEKRPEKKRRGNDGRNLRPSTTANELPIERVQPEAGPLSTDIDEGINPSSSAGPTHPHGNVIRRGQPNPVKRGQAVWEVENSPGHKSGSTVIKGNAPVSRQQSVAPNRLNRLGKRENHPVVVHNHIIHSSATTPSEGIDNADSPDPIQVNESTGKQKREPLSLMSSHHFVAPNQVFAFFSGRPQGYFPATCVGASRNGSQLRYLVRFEDTDRPGEVNADGVKRLELRINDVVKVDFPNVPKAPHIVLGFRDKLDVAALPRAGVIGSTLMTDVHGYSSVMVKPKHSNSSPEAKKPITVPISSIYFDKHLWARLEGRQYSNTSILGNSTPRPATPIDPNSSPPLPPSRTPRSASSGLFTHMAFAVSYKDNEETKLQVEELITQGGGQILKGGFDELFILPPFLSAASSKSTMTIDTDTNNEELLRLTPVAQQLGFTCLITDQHSRRAKYMQALALNIPCLSGRWIKDCVVKNQILDWGPYLLPSGESKFLDGAVRSRILTPYPAPTACLPDTIAGRPKLLAGQSVLVVMDRGKVAEQRRAYVFLTYVLGARKVRHVQDLKTASESLLQGHEALSSGVGQADDHGWDWIYVGDQKAASSALRLLTDMCNFGSAKQHSGHKRKRKRAADAASTYESGGVGDVIVNGRKTRLLDNDFVCQSLISGKLFEQR